MRLVEQWSELLASLPQGWQRTSVTLELDDSDDADRAALVLGPAAPWRVGSSFRLDVVRRAGTAAVDAGLVARTLTRLDADGIEGRLTAGQTEDVPDVRADRRSLAAEWLAVTDALPPGWSHALARVTLDSTDFVDRGALLMAPCNPQLVDGRSTLQFRVATSVGYGVATEMARRCLERLDGERITGSVEVVHAVSDAHPVATQGPVFRLGGRSL